METRTARITFVSLGDLLQSYSDRCLRVEAGLRQFVVPCDGAGQSGYDLIMRQELELAGVLKRFARKAPAALRDTRYQYTPEALPPERPGDVDDALTQLEEVNFQLSSDLRDLVANAPSPGLAESLNALSGEVESLARKISMTCVTWRDG